MIPVFYSSWHHHGSNSVAPVRRNILLLQPQPVSETLFFLAPVCLTSRLGIWDQLQVWISFIFLTLAFRKHLSIPSHLLSHHLFFFLPFSLFFPLVPEMQCRKEYVGLAIPGSGNKGRGIWMNSLNRHYSCDCVFMPRKKYIGEALCLMNRVQSKPSQMNCLSLNTRGEALRGLLCV